MGSSAARAGCEVEGVEEWDGAAARHFGDWVRRQAAHRGVRVHIEGDRSIHLEVFITVDSEAKLADGTAPLEDLVRAHEEAGKLLAETQARLAVLQARADETARLLAQARKSVVEGKRVDL